MGLGYVETFFQRVIPNLRDLASPSATRSSTSASTMPRGELALFEDCRPQLTRVHIRPSEDSDSKMQQCIPVEAVSRHDTEERCG